MSKNINDRFIDALIITVISIASLLCLIPMFHIFAVSFSSNGPIMADKVTVYPIDWNTNAYKAVLGDFTMVRSLLFTIVLVALFTALSMLMTVFAAYPLTKPKLKGRNFFLMLIVITMFFSGGLIPDYLLVKNLHLLDSIWALILPGVINAFYLIILKTFFSSIPTELEESARMDGASHFRILLSIILPLSLPVLATLGLFYAVNRWNGFMDALIYITNPHLFPIQLKLYEMVINNQVNDMTATEGFNAAAPIPESLKSASIVFATVPILLVYPWLQRYFISGIMIGAVKG